MARIGGKLTNLVFVAVLTVSGASVSAAPIISVAGGAGGSGLNAALAAHQDFLNLAQASSTTIEDFSGFAAGTQGMSFSTAIGEIAFSGSGNGSSCSNAAAGFQCGQGGGIVDITEAWGNDGPSPGYWGRLPVPDDGVNVRYLDTLDMPLFTITPVSGHNAIGFFITDPNDAGGNLVLNGQALFPTGLTNNHTYWVSVIDLTGADLPVLSFNMNNRSDGIGFDTITLARVPEPSAILLLGAGLLLMGLMSRRRTRLTA